MVHLLEPGHLEKSFNQSEQYVYSSANRFSRKLKNEHALQFSIFNFQKNENIKFQFPIPKKNEN